MLKINRIFKNYLLEKSMRQVHTDFFIAYFILVFIVALILFLCAEDSLSGAWHAGAVFFIAFTGFLILSIFFPYFHTLLVETDWSNPSKICSNSMSCLYEIIDGKIEATGKQFVRRKGATYCSVIEPILINGEFWVWRDINLPLQGNDALPVRVSLIYQTNLPNSTHRFDSQHLYDAIGEKRTMDVCAWLLDQFIRDVVKHPCVNTAIAATAGKKPRTILQAVQKAMAEIQAPLPLPEIIQIQAALTINVPFSQSVTYPIQPQTLLETEEES